MPLGGRSNEGVETAARVVHGAPRSVPHVGQDRHQFGRLASGFRLLVHLQGVLVAVNRGHKHLPGLDGLSGLLDTGRVLSHHGDEGAALTRKPLRGGT